MTTFSDSVTPPAMWATFQRLCEQQIELRTLFYIMGSAKVVEWIQSIGVSKYSELAGFVPEVPAAELRAVVAAPEKELFLWTGLVDLTNFVALYRRHAQTNTPRPHVFDFGCGCGRMTRFFCHSTESWEVSASDVNEQLVNFCQQHLPGVSTSLNNLEPPLPFAKSTFDLVYSLSIFTHFKERYSNLWLSEIARTLKPGGILILTTHGHLALETIRNSSLHREMFQMSPERVEQIQRDFSANPYVFQKYSDKVLEDAKAGSEYGNTFIHPKYIQSQWNNEQFVVLEHIPGGLRGWQDIVVLRRRS